MRESLCSPLLSICKHWKRVRVDNATRATVSGYRRLDPLRTQVIGADLVGRAGNNLLGRQHASLDKAAYPVVCNAQGFRSLGHGQPGSIFFRGPVSVDSTYTPDRSDTVSRPGLTLSGGHAHSIERRGDMFVRPAPGHAPHHRQRILGGRATMFARSRLAHPQTPFCLSSGDARGVDLLLALHDESEDLAGEVALEGADGVELGMPLGDAARDELFGPLVGAPMAMMCRALLALRSPPRLRR